MLSCIHHRDQARVYGKRVLEGRGELELSPEEAEAVRLALTDGGACHGRPPGRRPSGDQPEVPDGERRRRVGYPRAGGHVQRGGAARERRAGGGRARAARRASRDAVAALREGEVEWAIVPIENSLEGSINVTLDLLAEQSPRR